MTAAAAPGMVYVHVPFCASRCIYCDFYSTVQTPENRARYARAAAEEVRSRADELPTQEIQSVYFGGGTPSQLSVDELGEILSAIKQSFRLRPDAEITIEANPDDITPQLADSLKSLGFNRASLGVQSFNDDTLRLLNRRHTAAQARRAVETLGESGITNLSIDLIYGLPGQSVEQFRTDLAKAFALPISHLSAYALTMEDGTPLAKKVEAGKLALVDEDTYLNEYALLMDTAAQKGFVHYEISNFALPGRQSRHNSGYWHELPYVGIGPGAHSYDGHQRRSNRPNLLSYIGRPGHPEYDTEQLTADEQFNEFVFTSLRTRNGLDLDKLALRFGPEPLQALLEAAAPHLSQGRLVREASTLRLTRQGIMLSDMVMSDLMRV